MQSFERTRKTAAVRLNTGRIRFSISDGSTKVVGSRAAHNGFDTAPPRIVTVLARYGVTVHPWTW